MPDIPFYKTVMGSRFYSHDFPRLVNAIEDLTKEMRKKL